MSLFGDSQGSALLDDYIKSTIAPSSAPVAKGGASSGFDWAGLGNSAAQLGVNLFTTYSASRRERERSRINKIFAGLDASRAKAMARINEKRFRAEATRQRGARITQAAASGTTLAGSSLDVLAEADAQAELDAQLILLGGDLEALDMGRRGAIGRIDSRNRRTAGQTKFAATLLTGAGRMVDEYVL